MRVLYLLLLLSIAAVVPISCNLCEHKNPFLDSLKSATPRSVYIFTTPLKGRYKFCKGEWSTYGTCCDPVDLKKFYELEAKLIDINKDKLTAAVASIRKKVDFVIKMTKDKSLKRYSDEVFPKFKHNSNKCWDYMKKMRGTAMCSTCSGRSEVYFSNGKILISPKTCKQAVNH